MSEVEILEVNEWGVREDGRPTLLRKHAYVCGPGGGSTYAGLASSSLVGAIAAWLDKTILRPVQPRGEPSLPVLDWHIIPTPLAEMTEGFSPHAVSVGRRQVGFIALSDTAEAASPVVTSTEALDQHRPSRAEKSPQR